MGFVKQEKTVTTETETKTPTRAEPEKEGFFDHWYFIPVILVIAGIAIVAMFLTNNTQPKPDKKVATMVAPQVAAEPKKPVEFWLS